MTARTIVTSQPDVACEVCERRLLRGEQPDVFVVAGQRRIVCELCAPRAAHEGWLRESEAQAVTLPPLRPRRGRSLLERLSMPFRTRQASVPSRSDADASAEEIPAEPFGFLAEPEAALGDGEPGEPGLPAVRRTRIVPARRRAEAAPDRAGERAAAGEGQDRLGEGQAPGEEGRYAAAEGQDGLEEGRHPAGAGQAVEEGQAAADSYATHAVAIFNASEFPRRVAGVARSLGAPEVNVRSAEHLESVVRIVVAWELCWYRYEVDLSDGPGEAVQLEQGTELSELSREDRLANAAADDEGALQLLAG